MSIEPHDDREDRGAEVQPRPDPEVVDAELIPDEQTGEVELYREPAEVVTGPVTPLPAPWAVSTPERRPVVAGWVREAEQRKAAAAWAVGYAGHVLAFHLLRVPLYGLRAAGYVPRGMGRIVFSLAKWAVDGEAMPLRLAAVREGDSKLYMSLCSQRDDLVKGRRIALLIGLVALVVAAVVLRFAPWWAQTLAVLAVLGTAARAGRSAERSLMDTAVLSPKVRKLSADVVQRAFIAAGLAKEDNGVTFATPIHRDANGWRVVLDLPFGTTADKAMLRRTDIASGLDVDERQTFLSRVRGVSGSARRVALWVADEDPLAVPAGPTPLIRASRVNFWTGFPFGADERGNTVMLTMLWAAMLVGAIPRQGKTFVARLATLAAVLDPHVQIRIHDLKGGPDWVPFRHVAHRLFFGDRTDPDTGVDPVLALLDGAKELLAEVDHRNRTLRTLPAEVCPEGKLTEELSRTKSANMPLILMVIDEVQRAFGHKEYGAELDEVLTDLAKVGPSAGIMLLAATQKPDAKSTPTGFRDQFGIKFALRVTTRDASEAVLGAGAYGEGLDASRLSPDAKGCGLLRGTGDGDVTGGVVRTHIADGTDAETICLRGRALREAADTLTGMAAGQVPSATPPTYSAAADVLQVMGSDDQAHSDVLCARLAERWPDRYSSWEPAQLAAALKPYSVSTHQVWGEGLDGARANRRGVRRADLIAVLDGPVDP